MVRFGAFEFDAVSRRLRREGIDVHLPPKVFELLAALVAAAPRVVAKRELHELLWPGGAVADSTLVALVKQLRRALNDSDRRAPLIRTVHGVGYAMDAPASRRERVASVAPERWLMAGQRRLALASGENIIGRDATAQVQLQDPGVSRRHARLLVGGAGTQIEDLASKNGTFLDGVRLGSGKEPLRDGSRLGFGSVELVYRESGGGMPTLTHLGPD
jgi:DNA-binding winged helix-turn-helix (wHTH) protein